MKITLALNPKINSSLNFIPAHKEKRLSFDNKLDSKKIAIWLAAFISTKSLGQQWDWQSILNILIPTNSLTENCPATRLAVIKHK